MAFGSSLFFWLKVEVKMFAKFSILLVFVLGIVYAKKHECKGAYKPEDSKGKLQVPGNCKLKPLGCPSSWKSGIPEGTETSLPMIYKTFLICQEGFSLCGYVPINSTYGTVLGHSGVTFGGGVDLGSKTRTSFPTLPNTLLDKLEPYFGLQKELAACAAIELPLTLTPDEANELTDADYKNTRNDISKEYDAKKSKNAPAFASLPRGIRTAIISVSYQLGRPRAYPKFWKNVTKNNWHKAVNELRHFYTNPKWQANKGYLRRRNDEADIIEATLVKCNRTVDVVFLIDESGSVRSTHFSNSLDFVKNMIKAFSNKTLSGQDGTRFGLSTFNDNYKPHFYLSNYTKQSDYLSAISRVSYFGGGTKLGLALGLILNDQFNEERGLRPEVDGVPRILIVLTDGKSSDNVSIPSKNIRDENIVIYAVGIAYYELTQLQEIASSESHVYELSTFSELDIFISTLASSTCYEPRSVSLNQAIKTDVAKGTYQYFSYKVKTSANLRINVVDLSGSTLVYASRTNPHPYKYDNDIAFDLSSQKKKVIVISPRMPVPNTTVKRSTDDELTQRIYVSVTSDTDSASFQMKANECDPLICKEGTYSSAANVVAANFVVISLAMVLMFLELYLHI